MDEQQERQQDDPEEMPVRGVADEVRGRLELAADPGRAPAMQAYMKSSMPFRGVRAADLARLCRAVFDAVPLPDEESWLAAVHDLWDAAVYREERYAAIHLAGHRRYRAYQQPRTLELYRHLVVTGAWWDLVDPVAANAVGPILLAHRDEVTPVVRAFVDEHGDRLSGLSRREALKHLTAG